MGSSFEAYDPEDKPNGFDDIISLIKVFHEMEPDLISDRQSVTITIGYISKDYYDKLMNGNQSQNQVSSIALTKRKETIKEPHLSMVVYMKFINITENIKSKLSRIGEYAAKDRIFGPELIDKQINKYKSIKTLMGRIKQSSDVDIRLTLGDDNLFMIIIFK